MIPEPYRYPFKCLLQWLHIREESGHPLPDSVWELSLDIWHSALLQRLLEGKEPHTIPPPTAHGEPWYALVEKGSATTSDVEFDDNGQIVFVEQSPWRIFARQGNAYLVSYAAEAPLYVLSLGKAPDPVLWKLRLIEEQNPTWRDLAEDLGFDPLD